MVAIGSRISFLRRRELWLAFFVATLAANAVGGSLTGKFVWPTSTIPVTNGRLTLTLSQAAVIPGSYAIVATPVTCYTSIDGSIVGLPNPQALPVIHAISGTGSLAAGTYFVVFTYGGAGGETLVSPEQSAVLAGSGELSIDPPATQPTGSTWNVYIGSSSGAETRQATALAYSTYTQSAPLVAGATQPAVNSSSCTFQFNDSTIPAPTYYTAQLSDSNGNALPGYPQNWYLAGASVDVSNIIPLAFPPSVRFAQPVLQNPPSTQAQSIASPLNLNGYAIDGTANLGPSLISAYVQGTLPSAPSTLFQWTPNVAMMVRRISAYAATAGSGGSAGSTFQVTDGVNSCQFSPVLAIASNSGSANNPSGGCNFAAGIPLSLRLTSDDHTGRPGNVTLAVEMVAQ